MVFTVASLLLTVNSAYGQISLSDIAMFAQFEEVSKTLPLISPDWNRPSAAQTLDLDAGQQTPYFSGLGEYLASQIHYPDLARENGVAGKVSVLLLLSAEGQVLETRVLESLGFGCDEAVLLAIQSMPAWSPAMNYGLAVKGKVIIEFIFRMP